jgi:hypothetical protein
VTGESDNEWVLIGVFMCRACEEPDSELRRLHMAYSIAFSNLNKWLGIDSDERLVDLEKYKFYQLSASVLIKINCPE